MTHSKYWKATEYRSFLLYTSPVVMKGAVNRQVYFSIVELSLLTRALCSDKIATNEELTDSVIKTAMK